MEKGRGKRTDTLAMDNDFVRRGDVKRLLENTVCLHEELPAQIDIIPAADVAPVRHGKWLEHRTWAKCSECEYLIGFETTYCPNCGARKDGNGE